MKTTWFAPKQPLNEEEKKEKQERRLFRERPEQIRSASTDTRENKKNKNEQ